MMSLPNHIIDRICEYQFHWINIKLIKEYRNDYAPILNGNRGIQFRKRGNTPYCGYRLLMDYNWRTMDYTYMAPYMRQGAMISDNCHQYMGKLPSRWLYSSGLNCPHGYFDYPCRDIKIIL